MGYTMVQYVSHTVAIQVHACYGIHNGAVCLTYSSYTGTCMLWDTQWCSMSHAHTVAIQVHACYGIHNGAVCLTYSSYTGTMVQYVSHTVAIQVQCTCMLWDTQWCSMSHIQ